MSKSANQIQDIDKVTPAGVFKLSVSKNPDYTGGYVLRFTDNKGDMGGVAIHSVYTGDVKENREAKLASKDLTDKKITFGCINVDASFFTDNIIPRIDKMENAGVVVIPDAQEQLDLFVKPTTEKVSAPAKEVKTEERTKIVGRETPYYNDFTSNLDERYFDNQIVKTREEKIADYAQVRAATRRLTKKVAKYGSDIPLQRELNTLLEVEEGIKSDLDMTKPLRNTAANFMAKATEELAEKNITPEVEAFIRNAFEKNPALLQGLRLSVRSQGDFGRDAGNFNPYARIVTLWKDSSGVEDAKTIRHELTHSLEQMMMPETKKVLVDQWARALERAIKNNVDKESQNYFQAVLEFNKNPSKENFDKATEIMPPSYDYYQYMNPSEYWAVNAEAMLGAKLGSSWTRFTNAIKKLLEGLKSFFGMNNKYEVHKAMDKILSGDMKRINNETLADYLLRGKYKINFLSNVSPRKNYKGNEAPLAEWNNPKESKLDNFIYEIQDKLIDTKRVIQEIEKTAGKTAEKWNVYMREELYHGRTSTRIVKFLRNDLSPIVKEMQKNNITIPEFDQYLHNRHAEERNIQVAKINPNMPDQGSGIKTIDANNYLNKLDPQKKKVFESLAKKADEIIKETQDILVKNGVESKDTIKAWNDTYKHYVPLMREDLDYVHHGKGYGQGYQVKGPSSKRATGSKKAVVDIFSTIALQRERAIIRSEKLRVGRALFGLVLTNPNPDFWLPINPDAIKNKAKLESELINMGLQPEDAKNFIQEPKAPRIDKLTGKVVYKINPALRNSDNVFAVRIDGKERYIIFNANDSRAMRMVESLKNLDAEQLGIALGSISQVTRYFASINTQYNPIFGIINFLRDISGAALNLSTTELKGKEAQVMAGVFPALFGIYGELRAGRKDKTSNAYYAKLFDDFSLSGGKTGYKDQFTKRKITRTGFKFESSQVNIVEQAFEDLNKKTLRKAVDSIFNWLSDYNDAMENAVRLSVYKVGLDMGLSKDRAASIAKNITVNFNRKGATSSTLNSLYAFFGSAVQGTARLAETLKGPSGRKIIAGGFILGAVQAIALAMAGFDDEEPKTFVKDKNMVLPIGDGKYITIPLPLGFNVLPGIGRITTEAILGELGLISTNKSLPRRTLDIANLILDSFNPLGGGQLAQVITPTIADPIIGIATNRDTFGRPISREDRPSNPTPGYTRSRENANVFSKYLAEILNDISGGTSYKKGLLSPTADQIDYLVGQATGGVGREIQKSFETVKSQYTGEDQPTYRVPLLGRVYGDVNTPAAITSNFYENIKIMAEHENEIKGRAKNKENVSEYLKEYPESKMISYANQVESDVAKINKLKKDLIQLDQPKDKIQKLENQKINIMRLFNNRLKTVKERGNKPPQT